ncbi:putative bifunctional diguanylate cyclase/phosphodiesterase [Acidithiobacillus thiooxidans]|uniref:putative bifunctional diguanylate cyclase/phosphodiesterase n=1 Tax=Acidithiobacillus thiooxidans TaxID=930 RepID=UPI00129E972B|nr:EAL domain-containing protein [Acidithiobacillus thiooxidans]
MPLKPMNDQNVFYSTDEFPQAILASWAPILENRANCPRSARIIAHHRPESPPTIIQNDCPRWARIRSQAIDNEEFVLHYQPKVNLASGKVVGAEALIRWNDPRTGLVPPDKFIPILEETGLISEVGRWALRRAVEDYLRWRATGLEAVRIAVNVSPLQLRNPGFVAEIERKIGIGAHAADGLELEITESMIMEDVKHSVSILRTIRDMGVHVTIDDFGTGFSSLGYLSKLPLDTLKIDRSFVTDITAGPQGLALVTTIISLAHALKLKVVAEGVETEQQYSLLHLLSCDEMQGYLFSKPVPVEDFEKRFLGRM